MAIAGGVNRTLCRGLSCRAALTLLVALALPCIALAQTDAQLWGEIILNWVKSDRLTYELSIEPKVLVAAPAGDPDWATLDATPTVEYGLKRWLDLVGELATGYTAQTDDLNSFELSPRAGVRFHLFSRDLPKVVHARERPPRRKVVVRDLLRIEWRKLFYNQNKSMSPTWRVRNRLEFLVPVNKDRLTDDGTRYLMADWEWFVPVEDVRERFANKQRIRAGFGYRPSFTWRFEALYIWGRSRNTASEGFSTSDNIIDFRLKRIF